MLLLHDGATINVSSTVSYNWDLASTSLLQYKSIGIGIQ